MATILYYNFPEIPLPLQGVKSPSSNEIQLQIVGQPITNIQLNNINYSAKSIIIASSSETSNTPGHLIVKCYADVNDTTSNMVYIAIPLVVPPPSGSEQKPSDIDNIINSTGNSVKLSLNNYIKPDGGCVIPNANEFPLTITLDSDSAIPIQQYTDKKFYQVGSIPSLSINKNPKNNKNATLHQQDLDWIMSCELLTEDGPTEKQTVDPGSTATTISLFLMAILIAATAYISSPILYKELGIFRLAERLDNNHITINMYWGIVLIILAILCFSYNITSGSSIFSFISFALVLSYFSATNAILKIPGIANENGTWFSNTESMFGIFSEIIRTDCYTGTGIFFKGLAVILFLYSLSMVSSSIGLKNSDLFVSHMILYLFAAVGIIGSIVYFKKM